MKISIQRSAGAGLERRDPPPLDPSDNDWKHAMAIVCEVTGRRVGAKKLHGRELIYAGANAARISASELVHDETSSDLSQ
jgi:hypothetical protein